MAKKTEVTDPLEAAKISAPAPQDAPQDAPAPQAPQASSVAEEPVLAHLGVAPKGVDFRVLSAATLSWGGQFIRLHVGGVVSDRLYGAGAVERMRLAGVALEPVG